MSLTLFGIKLIHKIMEELMKKLKVIGLCLVVNLIASFAVALIIDTVSVFAENNYETSISSSIEEKSNELFGDVRIKSSEYLYSLDESPDFIYIDFEDFGYAIFLRDNLELLEYAPQGNLPYLEGERKYYCGPKNYFNKASGQFVNIFTNESFLMSAIELETYSHALREAFSASDRTAEAQDTYA